MLKDWVFSILGFPVEVLVLLNLGHLFELSFEDLKGFVSVRELLLDYLELLTALLKQLKGLLLVDLVLFVVFLTLFVDLGDADCSSVILAP